MAFRDTPASIIAQVVVNIPVIVLEIYKQIKIVLAGVPGVALHFDLDEILNKC